MSDDDKLVEAGKAIAVGPLCTFIQPGDTFFFLAYGAEVTPDVEGERYWTVAEDSAFIMGKLHV